LRDYNSGRFSYWLEAKQYTNDVNYFAGPAGKWNKFPDKYKTINQAREKEFNGNDEVVVVFHQFENFFFLFLRFLNVCY
jgi:hypothetical protein